MTAEQIAAVESSMPLVLAYDRAVDAAIDAAVKLVESAPWVGSKRGTVVDDATYATLAARVARLRDIPVGHPAGRRWVR